MIKRLFWDIEVTPNVVLSWGIGNNISLSEANIVTERSIICIAYQWEHEEEPKYLSVSRVGNDKTILTKFLEIAEQADELVAHNGDRFDLKWFRARCLYHGIVALPLAKTVDTLQIVRRTCKFNNAKMGYLAELLGIDHQKGSPGYSLWKKALLGNDSKAVQEIAEYCAQDVKVLKALYDRIVRLFPPKTHAGVMAGLEKWTCPRCGSVHVGKSKTRTTTAGTVQHQMKCKDCHGYYSINDASFRKYLDR